MITHKTAMPRIFRFCQTNIVGDEFRNEPSAVFRYFNAEPNKGG
jgi:hypothetical protein